MVVNAPLDMVPQELDMPSSTVMAELSRNVGIFVTPVNSLDTTSVVHPVLNSEYACEPPMFTIWVINRVSSFGNLGRSRGAVFSLRTCICST